MLSKALTIYMRDYVPGFDWGSANCCHFAAGWVRELTGRDVMAGLPNTPTEKDSRRLLRVMGGLREAVTKQSGLPQIAAEFAQVGDVVLSGRSLGICAGRTSVHVGESGQLVNIDMAHAICAWRVTCV